MSLKHFGTDGIRGPYGGDTLNDAIAVRAGKAAVRVARQRLRAASPEIVVGRDTRASGVALTRAFAAGVLAEGGKIFDLGVAPTPCVAFAARMSEALLACSLTASHNPAADNGIKFFSSSGVKPSEVVEQALDDAVGQATADNVDLSVEPPLRDGAFLRDEYCEALGQFFPEQFLAGKRVALDCANGAMSEIAPKVFRSLGAEVDTVGVQPDGGNINAGVGSECPEAILELYRKNEYDFGFAFDGDGDRLVCFDADGKAVAGEAVLALLAVDAKERGALPADTLVTTVQSNLGLSAALKKRGIHVETTPVGDKHIARLMVSQGFALGGEESGHVVLGDFAVTGDGLVAALAVAEVACRTGKQISELASVYAAFPQASIALKVSEKRPLETCSKISECIAAAEAGLGESGRLLVRYSGTEPKIRLLVEASDQAEVDAVMAKLVAAVREDLEVVTA